MFHLLGLFSCLLQLGLQFLNLGTLVNIQQFLYSRLLTVLNSFFRIISNNRVRVLDLLKLLLTWHFFLVVKFSNKTIIT
jgi:hypothetical protein